MSLDHTSGATELLGIITPLPITVHAHAGFRQGKWRSASISQGDPSSVVGEKPKPLNMVMNDTESFSHAYDLGITIKLYI
jgi:hypothetical protein